MIVFITILSTLSTFQSLPEDQAAYEEIVEQATFNCPRIRNPEKVNQKLLWELVNIEREFNVPPVYRGMLLAAACHESGYNPNAKGDRKFSKKRKPKAIGLLQFWKWAEKYIDRTNPIESARFWMKRIKRQIPFIKKKCRWRSEKRIWLAAWVTAIRYPKKSGRCYEKPKHYYQLKKWKKAIEKKRKKGPSC
tara:strand:+ start:1029 stop:1604 length:576 start_codon:yes stop_codon:yes gene_type:complete